MITRIKTAAVYGLIMAFFLVPGYWYPEITALLLVVVGVFAAREMHSALANIDIHLSSAHFLAFNLAFVPSWLFLIFSGKDIVTAKELFDSKELLLNVEHHKTESFFRSLFHEIDLEILIRMSLLYLIVILIIAGVTIFVPLLNNGSKTLPQIIITLASGCYVSLPLFFAMLLLYIIPGGWIWFLLAIVTPWISDSAAYFSGVLWGKKLIVPALSPKKTYVGFWGSIIGTILFYVPLYIFFIAPTFVIEIDVLQIGFVVIIAGVIGALIELGDWLASGIKRYCKIKDFSNLLPGHGGIIDRYDSTFFAFTAILSIALLVYFF